MDGRKLLCHVFFTVDKHTWLEYEFQQLLINIARQPINNAVKVMV